MAADLREPEAFDEVVRLEAAGDGVYRTTLDGFEGLSFGGQTLGCATLAAARTCEDRPIHSLNACFVRRVPADVPVELRVQRISDGRRIARRRVSIEKEGRLLFELFVSLAASARGFEHQDAGADPATPQPEGLPTDAEVAEAEDWEFWTPGALEQRWVGSPWRVGPEGEPSHYRAWLRPRRPLPQDAGFHAAFVAFVSDHHSHWPVARRLGGHFEPWGYTSLDTTVWLHRDVPWDDWRLLVSESDVSSGGRALTRRQLYTRDGQLVASMAQEALIPQPSQGGES